MKSYFHFLLCISGESAPILLVRGLCSSFGHICADTLLHRIIIIVWIMKPLYSLILACFCGPLFAQFDYPATRMGNEVSLLHGTTVADPYRWLESYKSEEVKTWINLQHQFSMDYLSKGPTRARVRELLSKLNSAPTYSPPIITGGRQVWLETQPNFQQGFLRTRAENSEVIETIVDANKLSSDGSLAISMFNVSPDGRVIIYKLRVRGTQNFKMIVKSLGSDDHFYEIPNSTGLSASNGIGWVNGSKGFYYTKEVKAAVPSPSTPSYQALYYHTVGATPDSDVLVYGSSANPGLRLSCNTSRDGKYLYARIWTKSGHTNGVLLVPLQAGIAAPERALIVDEAHSAKSTPLGVRNDILYLLTNESAPNRRVVAVDPKRPEKQFWRTVVAESDSVIDDAVLIGEVIATDTLVDASSELRIYSTDGSLVRNVDLPGVGALSNLVQNSSNFNLIFGFQSINQPKTIHELDLTTFKTRLLTPSKVPFDSAAFEVRREFVKARDGARIPVFIALRRGLPLDGSTPLLLIGYGGFGVPMGPGFGVREAAWLEMGGAIAIASIRGGGEYGERWHRAGMLFNKRNSISDFVDVGRWLIDQKFTSSSRLGISGISNGGLIVSAAVNDEPQLFGAVVNSFGLTDMVRNESIKSDFDWTDEFGSVADEASFRNLLSYSPLHNIKPNVPYPPIFTHAAELDDRVFPWHQYKYVAALQNNQLGRGPHLLVVSYGTGHVYGKSLSTLLNERTDVLSFLAISLGLSAP